MVWGSRKEGIPWLAERANLWLCLRVLTFRKQIIVKMCFDTDSEADLLEYFGF